MISAGFEHTKSERQVIFMENEGVTCDVCECLHNVGSNKCDLTQIKVTEQCANCDQSISTPHFCQSFEEK